MTLSYTFTPLAYPIPGVGFAYYTVGSKINDSGQVVGTYGYDSDAHAFLYSGGNYTTIDVPGSIYSEAIDISNDGKALLHTGSYNDGYYLYDNGAYTLLTDTPVGYQAGDVFTIGAAISDAGVVGYTYDPAWYADGQAQYQGFTYENGVYTAINVAGAQDTRALDINDSGQVVGVDDLNGISHGFLDVGGVITPVDDPLATFGTTAQWIANDGLIAGYYNNSTGQHFFLDDPSGPNGGTFTDIAVPGASSTTVNGISDAGVFGSYIDADFHEHGFIYKDGVYTTVDDPNEIYSAVTAMNDSGQLIETINYDRTEIGTLQVVDPTVVVDPIVVVDPTVVADHNHVNLYQTVIENAAHGVLANDTDPIPTDALSVSAVNGNVANVGTPVQGLYGALTLAADGSYAYTATAALPGDGVGFDTFSYTAETGAGGQATTDLTIVVVGSDKHYFGGTPDTTINGGAYNFDGQVLDGSQGNDVLIAGKSATVEIGGPGDTLTGSIKADKFVFHNDFGQNEITNFNPKNDTIWLDHTEIQNYQQVLADATQVGLDVVINDGTGDVIQLDHVQLSALHASDFHFV